MSTGQTLSTLGTLLAWTAWALPALAIDVPTGLTSTEIAPLPGHDSLVGYSIDDEGQVVGQSVALSDSGPSIGPFRNIADSGAFLWLPEPAYGLPAGTHEIPRIDADSIQVGQAINDLGQVVGWAARIDGEQLTDRRVFLWLPEPAHGLAAGSHDLGDNGGPANGVALDINDAGQIAGAGFDLDTGEHSGFLWDDGVLLELPGLAEGDGQSVAEGLNNLGEVVGRSHGEAAEGWPRATLWLPAPAYDLPAGANDLHPALVPLGALDSRAVRINSTGQVLGVYTVEDGDGLRRERGFIWHDGEVADLGTLGGDSALPMDLNDLGQVVGVSATAEGVYEGFIWQDTDATGPVILKIGDLLVPPRPMGAMAINDHTEIVGGIADVDGRYQSFLLSPIETVTVTHPECQPCLGYARLWVDADADPENADGGIDTPFVTIDAALAKAEMWGLCGVEIVLDTGTYDGFEVTRHTRILGDGGERVTIAGPLVNTGPFKLEVQGVRIAPTSDDPAGEAQAAVYVAHPDAVTVLNHVPITQARRFGVRHLGGRLFLQDVTVTGTRAEADDVMTGTAVYADAQAVCVLSDVTLTGNEGGALAVRGEGTTAYLERLRVVDTGYNPHFAGLWVTPAGECDFEWRDAFHGAVDVRGGALLVMRSAEASDSVLVGLDISDGARAHLHGCRISGTTGFEGSWCTVGGWNIAVRSGATVEIREFLLTGGVLGLALDQAYAVLENGEVTDNGIGVWVRPPDDPAYDWLACAANDVLVYDNELDFARIVGDVLVPSAECVLDPMAPGCQEPAPPPAACHEVPFEVPPGSDAVDAFTEECDLAARSNVPDLLVADGSSRQVLRYSGTAGAFIDRYIPAGSGGMALPSAIAFGPDDLLYVASARTSSVLRFDGTTGAFVDTFVPDGSGGLSLATGLTFGPSGDLLVSSHDTDSVLRFDGETGSPLGAYVPSGSGGLDGPWHLELGPDGDLYVASGLPSRILRYDGVMGAFVGHFVGDDPATPSIDEGGGHDAAGIFAFGPDGDVYVPGLTSARVQRYDGTTGVLVGEVVDVRADIVERFGSWAQVAALPTLAFGPGDDLYLGALVGVMGTVIPEGELLPAVHGYGLVLRYDPDNGWLRDILVGDDPGTLGLDEGGGLVYPMDFAFFPSETASFTGTGSNVVVVPVDVTTGGTPVTLTFALVTESGLTTLETSNFGPESDPGLGLPKTSPAYYDVETTARFDGLVTVCIEYEDGAFADSSTLGLFHYEDGAWVDSTTTHDPDGCVICGEVTTLSPFAPLEAVNHPPVAQAVVEQLTAGGAEATVLLDGSGSSDADHPRDVLTFTWTSDGVLLCGGPMAQCERLEVDLVFGEHHVALKVTDPEGAFDISSTTVMVEAGQLSSGGGCGCDVAGPDGAGTTGAWTVLAMLLALWLMVRCREGRFVAGSEKTQAPRSAGTVIYSRGRCVIRRAGRRPGPGGWPGRLEDRRRSGRTGGPRTHPPR